MNGVIDRDFALQILIALVVIAGAWMMFVEPKANELVTLEATIAASAASNTSAGLPLADLAREAASVRSRINAIAQHNQVAMNSADLYAQIGHLAEQYGVTVLTIRPGTPSDDTDKNHEKATVQTVTIDLSVVGEYESAAAFLDAMSTIGGFVRPMSLSLVPDNKPDSKPVVVRYVCEILQFQMPDTLAAFMEAGHGE